MSNFSQIENAIEKGGEISPFLFLSNESEIFYSDMRAFLLSLLSQHNIDSQSLFILEDTWETLKLEEMRRFIAHWDIRPRFAFQIFLIENISRMTPQSQNACLKFFEEPWEWNIIILTNTSEAWILETILSRVQVYASNTIKSRERNEFYYSMILSHVSRSSDELVRYFFPWKFEKQEYIDFLFSLIEYISQTWNHRNLLDEIHEDIWGILKNNLQGRYIVDKYIMKLVN